MINMIASSAFSVNAGTRAGDLPPTSPSFVDMVLVPTMGFQRAKNLGAGMVDQVTVLTQRPLGLQSARVMQGIDDDREQALASGPAAR